MPSFLKKAVYKFAGYGKTIWKMIFDLDLDHNEKKIFDLDLDRHKKWFSISISISISIVKYFYLST